MNKTRPEKVADAIDKWATAQPTVIDYESFSYIVYFQFKTAKKKSSGYLALSQTILNGCTFSQ